MSFARLEQAAEGITLVLILVFFSITGLSCIPSVGASQVRLEDISGEGGFFWSQNLTNSRWIPQMQIYLNNTSGMNLHLDMENVTFQNIVYENGTMEKGFNLWNTLDMELPIGGIQYFVTLSEFGFDSKPASFDFTLELHVVEAKGNIIFTRYNATSPISMQRLLQRTELQYDILEDGRALVTYSMIYRNPSVKPITVEIGIRYVQTGYALDGSVPTKVDDPIAGEVHKEPVENGTLIYLNPYLKKIEGGSAYALKLSFMLKGVANVSGDSYVVNDLRLVQLPYVQAANLKVRIPEDNGIFDSLSNVDSSNPPDSPVSFEVGNGRTWYTLSWNSPSQGISESFFVIGVSEISYQYKFDLAKTGLTLSNVVSALIGIIIGVCLAKLWGLMKNRKKQVGKKGVQHKQRNSILGVLSWSLTNLIYNKSYPLQWIAITQRNTTIRVL